MKLPKSYYEVYRNEDERKAKQDSWRWRLKKEDDILAWSSEAYSSKSNVVKSVCRMQKLTKDNHYLKGDIVKAKNHWTIARLDPKAKRINYAAKAIVMDGQVINARKGKEKR